RKSARFDVKAYDLGRLGDGQTREIALQTGEIGCAIQPDPGEGPARIFLLYEHQLDDGEGQARWLDRPIVGGPVVAFPCSTPPWAVQQGRCAGLLEGYAGRSLIDLVLPVLAGGDDAAETVGPRDDDGPGRAVPGREHFEKRASARQGGRSLRLME